MNKNNENKYLSEKDIKRIADSLEHIAIILNERMKPISTELRCPYCYSNKVQAMNSFNCMLRHNNFNAVWFICEDCHKEFTV